MPLLPRILFVVLTPLAVGALAGSMLFFRQSALADEDADAQAQAFVDVRAFELSGHLDAYRQQLDLVSNLDVPVSSSARPGLSKDESIWLSIYRNEGDRLVPLWSADFDGASRIIPPKPMAEPTAVSVAWVDGSTPMLAVRSEDNAIVGLLDARVLAKLAAAPPPQRASALHVVDSFGRVIAKSSSEGWLQNSAGARWVETTRAWRADARNEDSQISGPPAGFRAWTSDLSTLGWTIVLIQDESVYAKDSRHAISIAAVILIAGIVVAMAVSILLRAWVAAPLVALSEAFADVAAGRLDRRINLHGADEHRAIGEGFSSMVATLERTHGHLDAIVAATPLPLALLELSPGLPVLGANPAWREQMGGSEMVGSRAATLGLPAALEDARALAHQPQPVSLRLGRADGSAFQAQLWARTVALDDREGILVVLEDITDRQRLEYEVAQARAESVRRAAQIENEARLRAVLQAAGDGTWDLDLGVQRLTVSGAWLGLLAVDKPLPPTALVDLALPADRPSFQAVLDAAGVNGHPFRHAFEVQTRGGDRRWLQLRGGRIDTVGGGRMLGIATDITDAKYAEARLQEALAHADERNAALAVALDNLRRAKDELVRSEKLAGLGAMVAGVAHELNTPIGNALMMASTIADGRNRIEAALDGQLRKTDLQEFLGTLGTGAELIMRSLQRAAELVHSFKRVAVDQSSEQRRRFDLGECLRETLLTLGPALRKSSAVLDYEDPPATLMDGWPGALSQVLMNLVNNSLLHGFAERGGRLVVRAVQVGADVRIEVQDDGQGIPAEHLGKVFDPFFTTRLGTGGSGLGMHIVYTLVTQLMGGRIALESAPGAGTKVTLFLPLNAPRQSETTNDLA